MVIIILYFKKNWLFTNLTFNIFIFNYKKLFLQNGNLIVFNCYLENNFINENANIINNLGLKNPYSISLLLTKLCFINQFTNIFSTKIKQKVNIPLILIIFGYGNI